MKTPADTAAFFNDLQAEIVGKLSGDLRVTSIARRLVIQRVEALPPTDDEWAALLTLIQVVVMHGFSLAQFRSLLAMLAAAQPEGEA